MNSDVTGEVFSEYSESILKNYDIIILNELDIRESHSISDHCEKLRKKSVMIHTNGLIGSVSLAYHEHYYFEK